VSAQPVSTPDDVGFQMYQLIADLYPLCRSITGNGLRETLRRIQQQISIVIHEVPSGTQVFDWTVPNEWNIRDACVRNKSGHRIIDFQKSNLHVVNYSAPIHRNVSRKELLEHLYTLPDQPEWIPYRTSYYNETWGFCAQHSILGSLKDEEYEVLIDSSLRTGHLSYGEFYLRGDSEEEILISCHSCHPSLCNDNLSGISVAVSLAREIERSYRHYSYRFLFIPGTIGSITWLARNEAAARKIKWGITLANVGDSGSFTYKKSRRGNTDIDRAADHVLKHSRKPYQTVPFAPYGYDERQFCSPAFNLAVGCLSRSQYGKFPEYHTSADNLEFVKPEALTQSFAVCRSLLSLLDNNAAYVNLQPKCEPQLGKRGLYRTMGGYSSAQEREMAMLWVLNLSDGDHTLLDIAERSDLPFNVLHEAAQILVSHSLLKRKA